MNRTVSIRKLCRWLPRLALPAVVLVLLVGAIGARTATNDPVACSSGLGQQPPQVGQSLSGHLDILSWNIQKASNDGWAEDLAAMAGDVNLAFIQEARLQAMLPDAIPRDPLYQIFTRGFTTEGAETGVMTLSSHTPSWLCNFTTVEPWLRTPKAVTVTEHPLAGRDERLLAINIHAVNFTIGIEDLRRQLEPLVELLAHHAGPAILAGDFNTWSHSRQQLVDELLGMHGLAALEFSDDRRTRAFGRPLDHIYVRGLSAESAEVIPVESSDHNALRARLRID
jgi:endonuclease/exonuclease/phosphatase (EEP) superfamily protein YafD